MDAHLKAIGSNYATLDFKNDGVKARASELFPSFAGLRHNASNVWMLVSDEAVDVAAALCEDGYRVAFN